VDEFGAVTIILQRFRFLPAKAPEFCFDRGDQIMISPEPIARALSRLRFVAVAAAVLALGMLAAGMPATLYAQGLVKGMQDGAREGNKAAGPIGGVLGGAIGGVVGAVGGVFGNTGNTGNSGNKGSAGPAGKQDAAKDKGDGSKQTKAAKGPKGSGKQPAVLTQNGAPQLTAEQIVANSDANVERIKRELNLTPEQEKHWNAFNSAMHYLGNNGAERLNLRIARAQRDPPDDIIEQMRNEAQFLNDRAVDQRNVADSAEPLFASLDDKQKQVFINEMVRLSHERGLD
jgi:LTXXQ motif family protein